MGGGKVAGDPPYFKVILSLPLSRVSTAQSLLDAYRIPFQELLDPGSPDASPGRHVCVLYPQGAGQRDEWLGLLARAGLDGFAAVTPFDYDPALWVQRWKEYYEWVQVSPRLAIGPAFRECPFQCEHALRIDPGQAFGTGCHQSTQLAAMLMVQHLRRSESLLDVGCGTGVLAIAGALLGASPVTGVDVEQESCLETRKNAALNRVEVGVVRGSVDSLSSEWPVVVANMLYFRLETIARPLRRSVRPGGVLVLSGLVEKDRIPLATRFFEGDFEPIGELCLDDWWGGAWRRRLA